MANLDCIHWDVKEKGARSGSWENLISGTRQYHQFHTELEVLGKHLKIQLKI